MNFNDIEVGHTVIAQYKKAEYSSVFQLKVLERSPNNKYVLLESKRGTLDRSSVTQAWESIERLDSVFEIVDYLGVYGENI